jgi:hypothetical protein
MFISFLNDSKATYQIAILAPLDYRSIAKLPPCFINEPEYFEKGSQFIEN